MVTETRYPYGWSVIKTSYPIRYRRTFSTSDLDVIICGIIQEAGGIYNKKELGMLLGFAMDTVELNEEVKFYSDDSEGAIFQALLEPLKAFHLVEEREESIELTSWGRLALTQKVKFQFFSGSISFYKHLDFELLAQYEPFPYHEFHLYPSVQQQNHIAPYEIEPQGEGLEALARHYISFSPAEQRLIIDGVQEEYSAKEEVILDTEILLHQAGDRVTVLFDGAEVPSLTLSLWRLPQNQERHAYLVKKGQYEQLLQSGQLFGKADLLRFEDLIDWHFLIQEAKVEWRDTDVLSVFTRPDVSSGSLWALISLHCFSEVLFANMSMVEQFINWSNFTQKATKEQIFAHPQLSWDLEEILNVFTPEEAIQYLLKKAQTSPTESYFDEIPAFYWSELTSKTSLEVLKRYFSAVPFDCKIISRTHTDFTKECILQAQYQTYKWDWNYISEHFEIDFLAQNFERFSTKLNPERLFLRLAKEEERLVKFLLSAKTKPLKEALQRLEFKISYQEVVLNRQTLPLLDSFGFLSWGDNRIPGVELNKYITWDDFLIQSYSARLTSAAAVKQVSSSFQGIATVLNNPSFSWDYFEVIKNLEDNSLLEHLSLMKRVPDHEYTALIDHLSQRLDVGGALALTNRYLDDFKRLDLLAVLARSTSQILEENARKLISVVSAFGEAIAAIITSCTQKVSLQFILANTDLVWDWKIVTTEKLARNEIKDYYNVLAPYLDWAYIINNCYSVDEINNLDTLAELAVYINEGQPEVQGEAWKAITARITKRNIWSFVENTLEIELFKWDWTYISGSQEFMFSRFTDLSFLWEARELLDWSALSKNKLLLSYVKKQATESHEQWMQRISEYLDPLEDHLDWSILSTIANLTWCKPMLVKYIHSWNWTEVSRHSHYFTKYDERSKTTRFIYEHIKEFQNKVDFHALSSRQDVCYDAEFVMRYAQYNLNWSFIASNGKATLGPDLFITVDENGNVEYAQDKRHNRIADKPWDFAVLTKRKELIKDGELLKALSEKDWDWKLLSSAPIITNALLVELSDKEWDFELISKNKGLVFDKNLLKILKRKAATCSIDWRSVVSAPHFHVNLETLSLVPEEVLTNADWTVLSESVYLHSENITLELLEKYALHWNWSILLKSGKVSLTEVILVRFLKYISSEDLASYIDPALLVNKNFEFIKPVLNWSVLCRRKELEAVLHNADFVEANAKYLDWAVLSSNTTIRFSIDLLEQYKAHWDWAAIRRNPYVREHLSEVVNVFIKSDPRVDFLNRLKKDAQWGGYVYHFSHLTNALKIIKEKRIKSRNRAQFEDAAGSVVNRRGEAHDYARFYFRPQTPTQFYNEQLGHDCDSTYYEKARSLGLPMCPIPVFFRFSLKELLYMEGIQYKISNGNMQTGWARLYDIQSIIHYFDFEYLYSTFRCPAGYRTYMDSSQQEFLIRDVFDFSNFHDFTIIVPDHHTQKYLEERTEDMVIAKRIQVDSSAYNTFHFNNRSVEFEQQRKFLRVSTDYRSNHRFTLKFNSDVQIKEVRGEGIVKKSNAIDFKKHLTIQFANEPSYELLFYNEVKSEPWTIIQQN